MTLTTLVPSENLVLKTRLAFWNMPSFKLTTMNWLPLNLVLISRPIFCVCDRSSAASTSSKMYIGAGLNCSSAKIRESAMSDLAPVSKNESWKECALTSAHHSAHSNFASTRSQDTPLLPNPLVSCPRYHQLAQASQYYCPEADQRRCCQSLP